MNTKINLTYNGIDYTLEYDRMTIKMIENDGFELEKFAKQPMTMVDIVFRGAFYKNHRNINQTLVDEIYAHCKKKDELVKQLASMIDECYVSLMEDPDDEGNATWEVVSLSPKTKAQK